MVHDPEKRDRFSEKIMHKQRDLKHDLIQRHQIML